MSSLKELSAQIVINNELDRTILPQDVQEYLHHSEFTKLLNKLKYEDTDGRDEYYFTPNKIITSLDHKHYIQYNIQAYEQWYERWNGEFNTGNVVCPKIKYINYYLRQENHFEIKYPQKGNVKRCDIGECKPAWYCSCQRYKKSII